MENKKSDKKVFSTPSSPSCQPNSFPNPKQQQQQSHMKGSMFMRYASSIIQVVNQDKMEKSQPSGQNQYSNALVEISDVDLYGVEEKSREEEGKLSQPNHYKQYGQVFKKKKEQQKLFAYNFTNFSALMAAVSKPIQKTLKNSFQSLRKSDLYAKPPILSHKKGRTSNQSRSTNYTTLQQFKSRKNLESQKTIQADPQILKQGANAIKGWLQFKILMLKSSTLRTMVEYVEDIVEEMNFSPIQVSKKQSNTQERFYLTDYQNDNSITHIHQLQESLAYTADQNFELSSKEYTKHEKIESIHILNHKNMSTQPKESIVSPYKAHLKGSKHGKSKFAPERNVATAEPIKFNFTEERRYLNTRTNLYPLPLISDQDLRWNGPTLSKDLNVKVDKMAISEPEMICDQVENIMKDLESINTLTATKNTRLQQRVSPKNEQTNLKSYFESVREKYTHVGSPQNRDYENGSQTCRLKAKNPLVHLNGKQQNDSGNPSDDYQRKAPYKIDNYYFPGRQPKNTEKQQNKQVFPEATKTKLDEVKQVDSILSTKKQSVKSHQQAPVQQKQVRIEESVVSTFLIPDEPQIKSVKSNLYPLKSQRNDRPTEPKGSQYMHFGQRKSPEPSKIQEPKKHKPKVNIAVSPQRMDTSPSNLNIQYQNVQRKQDNIMSPQNSSRLKSNIRPSPSHFQISSKPLQEYGSIIRKTEPPLPRPESREHQIQKNTFSHNIYQINQPQSPSHVQPHPQLMQPIPPTPIKTGQPRIFQHLINPSNNPQPQVRPVSRIMSPQPSMDQNLRPASRQYSQKKQTFFSPQMSRDQYGIQPQQVKYGQEPRLQVQQHAHTHSHQQQQLTSKMAYPMQEYFVTEQPQQRTSTKAINYNNRYYCAGNAERQAPIMADVYKKPQSPTHQHHNQHLEQTRRIRPPTHTDRPHSSSRQSLQKLNIYSNFTPTESQLESQSRSKHLTSRNSSKLLRPKSMNEKIHITMRHR